MIILLGIAAPIIFTANYSYAQTLQDLACTACITISDLKHLAIHKNLGLPILLWAEDFVYTYDHNSVITINGHSKLNNPEIPITITVSDPIGNIVTIDQIMPKPGSDFKVTFNTSGPLWKKDGLYIIKAQGGAASTIFKTGVELTGAVPSGIACTTSELNANGYCIPYAISGATVSSTSLSPQSKSIVIMLDDAKQGTLTINPSSGIIQGIFMVLVDGEESNNVTIDGNEVTIMFPQGTSEIEVVGTFVIPEFGSVAVLILIVAIISTVIISSKKLNIVNQFPKFQ
jgi:predicted secreted protein with PEFG-CTERM motif